MKTNDLLLSGSKVYLRPVTREDANDNYLGWMNDTQATQYLEIRHIKHTLKDIKAYIEDMANKKDELFLAICLQENNQHIGNIKLGPVNPIHGYTDIGIFIGEKGEWGKGYATEAIQLLSAYAFDKLKLHKLVAGCYENNVASIRAFEKSGFKREFIQLKQYLYEGKYVDRVCLALFADQPK